MMHSMCGCTAEHTAGDEGRYSRPLLGRTRRRTDTQKTRRELSKCWHSAQPAETGHLRSRRGGFFTGRTIHAAPPVAGRTLQPVSRRRLAPIFQAITLYDVATPRLDRVVSSKVPKRANKRCPIRFWKQRDAQIDHGSQAKCGAGFASEGPARDRRLAVRKRRWNTSKTGPPFHCVPS